MQIDVGCGASPLPDHIGVDPFIDRDDIVKAPMWSLPFKDSSVSRIYSSHALEHIGKNQVLPTLREFYRVLSPNGVFELIIPDLEWCVTHWLKHKNSTGWDLDVIFGNQNHEGEYHKTGFTEYTITQYLTSAGFAVRHLERIPTHGQLSIRVFAFKVVPQ